MPCSYIVPYCPVIHIYALHIHSILLSGVILFLCIARRNTLRAFFALSYVARKTFSHFYAYISWVYHFYLAIVVYPLVTDKMSIPDLIRYRKTVSCSFIMYIQSGPLLFADFPERTLISRHTNEGTAAEKSGCCISPAHIFSSVIYGNTATVGKRYHLAA